MKKIVTLALTLCVVCSSAPAFAASIEGGVKAEGGRQGVGIQGRVQVKGTQGTQSTKGTQTKGTHTKGMQTKSTQPGTTGQPSMPKTGAGGASDNN
jgi:hypothetical protein